MQTYISTNIKYLRKLKGITQEQLAKVCGKGYTAVGNWETGIREPYVVDLANIANFFGVSIDDLIKKDLRLNDNEKNSN
jgi:transcriptional regulator with XRE-family HTH domain